MALSKKEIQLIATACADEIMERLKQTKALDPNARTTEKILAFVAENPKGVTNEQIEKATDCYGKTRDSLCYRARAKGWIKYDTATKLWTLGDNKPVESKPRGSTKVNLNTSDDGDIDIADLDI